MIEEEQPAAAETPEHDTDVEIAKPRKTSPWKAFILTGFLAGLIGAVGGGYGAYAALKKYAPQPVAQAEVDLSPLQSKLDRLTDRFTAVEAEFETIKNRPANENSSIDLSGVEDRLNALESAPTPEIDPEALSALQAAQKDGFEWPDMAALEDRLAALEADAEAISAPELPGDLMDRLSALEAEMEAAEPLRVPSVDLDFMSDFDGRLTALENRPEPSPVVKRVSILAFPKARMIETVEETAEGGMIAKTLSRHIRVKDANDPLTLIEGIETDLTAGDLAAAIDKFERLPSPVRSAGQAWHDSVKASL